jgi:hypothetical protein
VKPVLPLLLIGTAVAGCGQPSRPNILLRKQVQSLEAKIADLERQHGTDAATISGMTERIGTVPTLPPERLARLFTTNSITINRLTGGADFDPDKPGDEGSTVYVNVWDQHGDGLKMAGSFVVVAFDLADPQATKVGHWEFPVEHAQDYWHSFLMRYEYVLPCPWQDVIPRHADLTVRVTYTDELTGRKFNQQSVVKVRLPPSPQPTTQAARR